MITLPLFPSELLAAPKLEEHNIPIDRWLASSEALPEDGIPVYCYLSCNQRHRHYPHINELVLVDGQWVPAPGEYMMETHFPLEAVRWWMGIEPTPDYNHPGWQSIEQLPEQNCNMDVWIWNSNRNNAGSFWVETGNDPCPVDQQLYYGSGGDPVLHDEFVVKWMPRVQSEDIAHDFADAFDAHVWNDDRKLPNWLHSTPAIARESTARLFHLSRQLKLDLPRVS